MFFDVQSIPKENIRLEHGILNTAKTRNTGSYQNNHMYMYKW